MSENVREFQMSMTAWTILRACIILLAGVAAAAMLAPLMRAMPESASRNSTDVAALAAVLDIERALGSQLLSQKSQLEVQVRDYDCTAVAGAPIGTTLNGQDRADLRGIIDQSVVYISTKTGSGTGFFVAPGRIVTNSHVVGSSTSVRVFSDKIYGGAVDGTVTANTGHNADVMGSRDYAIVTVAPSNAAVPLVRAKSVQELDTVVSAGFPGLFQSFHDARLPRMILRQGEFISELPQTGGNTVIAHSAEVFPGNSGGPLLNKCGEVVGVNTFIVYASASGDQDGPQVKTDFALPAADLFDFLKQESTTFPVASGLCR